LLKSRRHGGRSFETKLEKLNENDEGRFSIGPSGAGEKDPLLRFWL
jgi:hypothetical protein